MLLESFPTTPRINQTLMKSDFSDFWFCCSFESQINPKYKLIIGIINSSGKSRHESWSHLCMSSSCHECTVFCKHQGVACPVVCICIEICSISAAFCVEIVFSSLCFAKHWCEIADQDGLTVIWHFAPISPRHVSKLMSSSSVVNLHLPLCYCVCSISLTRCPHYFQCSMDMVCHQWEAQMLW